MSEAPRLPDAPMTVDDFARWLEGGAPPGERFELSEGVVVRMAAERAVHNRVKLAAAVSLDRAATALPCEVLTDGMAVRVGDRTQREPDAALRCGPALPPDATWYDDPVVLVEVVSPGSVHADAEEKLADYMRLPSVAHYLIVHPNRRIVIHHRRMGPTFETAIVQGGTLALDPPGLSLDVDAVLAPVPRRDAP